LTVSWKYQTTSNSQEKTSLSYQIDLMKVLPEWITVGFSASTGEFAELNNLLSWEFNSTLDKSNDVNSKETKLISIVTISCGVFVLGVVVFVAYVILKSKRKRSKKQKEEAMHLTSTSVLPVLRTVRRIAKPYKSSYTMFNLMFALIY
jgi:heme/copper-type cytochrome/quinol oxidase subunit 2